MLGLYKKGKKETDQDQGQSVPVKLFLGLTHSWLCLFLKALEPVRTRDGTLLNLLNYEEPGETTTKSGRGRTNGYGGTRAPAYSSRSLVAFSPGGPPGGAGQDRHTVSRTGALYVLGPLPVDRPSIGKEASR